MQKHVVSPSDKNRLKCNDTFSSQFGWILDTWFTVGNPQYFDKKKSKLPTEKTVVSYEYSIFKVIFNKF